MRHHRRFADTRRASTRWWLRGVLLCALFASVQGWLGAWVVTQVSGEPAIQVCTPQGMRWVVQDHQPDDGQGDQEPGLMKPCVWAGAQVAIALSSGLVLSIASTLLLAPVSTRHRRTLPPDTVRRVLLMSAMRAPPARPAPLV